MPARTQAADSFAEIAKRVTEIQTERMQALAGCNCPPDLLNQKQHTQNCPLHPQISITITGMTEDKPKPISFGRVLNIPKLSILS